MAKSRRKAGGATAGRYKRKKMGKGWQAYREKLGFRPPAQPKKDDEGSSAEKKSDDQAS
jgi:hypothetical protein